MALTGGLNMALRGMMATEVKTTLSSQNISNADKIGYTRKNLDVRYITTSSGSTPVAGMVVGSSDKFMVQAVVDDISIFRMNTTVSSSLDYYSTQLGSTDGSNTMSTYLDNMYASLQYLTTSPEITANKGDVVQTSMSLASSLRGLSATVQNLRLDSEQRINRSIENINAILDRIDLLNDKITSGGTLNAGLAEYEDQRAQEIQNLSAEIDIQYFYTSDNRMQVYTGSGNALLLSEPHHISYTPTNVVNGTILYPANFSPIDLDGIDLTTQLRSGNLAGLVNLRDTVYVNEQEKLTEFANVLQTQVNTLLNTGASVPPRSLMEGSRQGLALGTAFTAAGSIRVAVTDANGIVVNYNDINLAAMTTVNDVITALNGVAGLTASLTLDGELSIAVAPTSNGVVINPLASAVTSSTGQSFSQYFGLNDLFTGTTAEDINVSDYLISGPEYLAISVLSSSATLAIGDRGVNRGDGTIADAISDMLNSNVSFAAAGDFSAQSNTLQRYIQGFMAAAASKADLTQRETDTNYQVMKASSDLLTSSGGVNVDEETAKLLLYQNQYEAGAQVVSTIQEMLQTLIDAMR